MSDLSAYSAHEFGPLCTVLRSVMDITATPGEQIMFVGASARDLIHRGLGFDSELASTMDIDIAIAVPDRFAYQCRKHAEVKKAQGQRLAVRSRPANGRARMAFIAANHSSCPKG